MATNGLVTGWPPDSRRRRRTTVDRACRRQGQASRWEQGGRRASARPIRSERPLDRTNRPVAGPLTSMCRRFPPLARRGRSRHKAVRFRVGDRTAARSSTSHQTAASWRRRSTRPPLRGRRGATAVPTAAQTAVESFRFPLRRLARWQFFIVNTLSHAAVDHGGPELDGESLSRTVIAERTGSGILPGWLKPSNSRVTATPRQAIS